MGNFTNMVKKYEFYKSDKKEEKIGVYEYFTGELKDFKLNDEKVMIQKSEQFFNEGENAGKEQKYELYLKALKYNNTNEKALLKILEISEPKEKDLFLKKYSLFLSEQNYYLYFNEKKKSSVELLKNLFELLKKYENKIISAESIWKFVDKFSLSEFRNTFSTNINDELLLLFLDLTKRIRRIMFFCRKLIYNDKMTFEDKLNQYFNEEEKRDILHHIIIALPNVEDNLKEQAKCNILLLHHSFFHRGFPGVAEFINDIENELLYCLDDFNDINFYILIYIIEIIINLLYGHDNSKNDKVIKKIKKYVQLRKKSEISEDQSEEIKIAKRKSIIYDQKNDKLIFKIYQSLEYTNINEQIKTVENAHIYDLELIKNIIYFNFEVPLEFQLLDYVKIEYMNDYNYIQYSKQFLSEFIEKMLKSKTIISLLNKIFPGCEKYGIFNESSNFLENLSKEVLDRYYFIELFLGKGGATYPEIKRIYYYTFNRYNKALETRKDFIIYLLQNLGCFIYIFQHEFLGHYLLHYLEIITKNEFKSPFYEIVHKVESGTFIEQLLYNKRVRLFNFSQILFILDIKNYDKDYKNFCNEFKNKNNNYISEEFREMIKKHFNFELTSDDCNFQDLTNLVGTNVSGDLDEIYVQNSTFESCISSNYVDFQYLLKMAEKKK